MLCPLNCIVVYLNCRVKIVLQHAESSFQRPESRTFCWVIYSKVISKISFSGDLHHKGCSQLVSDANLLTRLSVVLLFFASKCWSSNNLLLFLFVRWHSLTVLVKYPFQSSNSLFSFCANFMRHCPFSRLECLSVL